MFVDGYRDLRKVTHTQSKKPPTQLPSTHVCPTALDQGRPGPGVLEGPGGQYSQPQSLRGNGPRQVPTIQGFFTVSPADVLTAC